MTTHTATTLGGGRPLRVAVLARMIHPLHGYGGLQRHVYDLVRCLLDRGVEVTLITQPPSRNRPADPHLNDDGHTLVGDLLADFIDRLGAVP